MVAVSSAVVPRAVAAQGLPLGLSYDNNSHSLGQRTNVVILPVIEKAYSHYIIWDWEKKLKINLRLRPFITDLHKVEPVVQWRF